MTMKKLLHIICQQNNVNLSAPVETTFLQKGDLNLHVAEFPKHLLKVIETRLYLKFVFRVYIKIKYK